MFDYTSYLINNNDSFAIAGAIIITATAVPVIGIAITGVSRKYFEYYYKNNTPENEKSFVERNVGPISVGLGVMAGILAIPVIFILFMADSDRERLKLNEIAQLQKNLISLNNNLNSLYDKALDQADKVVSLQKELIKDYYKILSSSN